jgi:6-phosphogluconolactonase
MQATSRRQVHFVRDGENLSDNAAEAFVEAVESAVVSRGVAAVALCGGTIAKKLFAMLAEEPYASRLAPLWPRLHVFWTAERHVSPDHPRSSYRLAQWSLLSRFAVPSGNVHRIRAEMAETSWIASAYEHDMRTFFAPRGLMRDGLPCFDLTVLALDADPSQAADETRTRHDGGWVATRTAATRERGETLLTLPILKNARNSLVLFSGAGAAAECAAHLLRFVA